MRELDDAITTLRRELDAFGIEASTIDELADHLACAVEARVEAGDDVALAITDARTHLGDLGQFAREHVRVRGAFGPRPSRVQAYASIVAVLGFVVVVNDGHLDGIRATFTGTGVLTLLGLVGLAFRVPQASAFVLGQTAAALLLALGSGLLFAGERHGLTLLVLAIAPVILLGFGRMTRWRLAMIALGWTMSTMLLNVDDPGHVEELVFLVLSVLVCVTIFAVAVRARIARYLTIMIAAACVVCSARFYLPYLTAPWSSAATGWSHVSEACFRAQLVISYVAPVVAAIFAFSADRSIRAI